MEKLKNYVGELPESISCRNLVLFYAKDDKTRIPNLGFSSRVKSSESVVFILESDKSNNTPILLKGTFVTELNNVGSIVDETNSYSYKRIQYSGISEQGAILDLPNVISRLEHFFNKGKQLKNARSSINTRFSFATENEENAYKEVIGKKHPTLKLKLLKLTNNLFPLGFKKDEKTISFMEEELLKEFLNQNITREEFILLGTELNKQRFERENRPCNGSFEESCVGQYALGY